MAEIKERILVIAPDPNERAVIVEAALEPYGYQVTSTDDGSMALQLIFNEYPDAIVMDFNPPNLSGADILAALNSQSMDIPVVVLANPGREKDALHAFRLGARDYLVRPVREAELIQVVERVLKEGRFRRERERLIGEIHQAASDAEQRLREMRTLISIGKAVAASRNLDEVFDRVIRSAIHLTRAESVGFFLRDGQTNQLILRAGQNLSSNLIDKIGQPVEDQLANLVMTSREVYETSGEASAQFRPAQQGAHALIYAPLVVQDAAVGLLWVANSRMDFDSHAKELMGALSDYAGIAVVNAHLFNTMQSHSRRLEAINQQLQTQAGSQAEDGSFLAINQDNVRRLRGTVTHLMGSMNLFRTGEMGPIQAGHQAAVDVMHRELETLVALVDQLMPPSAG